MITDNIKNAKIYAPISKNLALGFKFIAENDLNTLDIGKYEIDGENVFAIVQQYDTKSLFDGAKWEAHKKYIDIQHVISGIELIGYAPLENMRISKGHDIEKDYALFSGNGLFLEATPDNFFVFYPQDVHMPGMMYQTQKTVKKLVVKVMVDFV